MMLIVQYNSKTKSQSQSWLQLQLEPELASQVSTRAVIMMEKEQATRKEKEDEKGKEQN